MNNFYQTFFVSGNALFWFSFICLFSGIYLHLKEWSKARRTRACRMWYETHKNFPELRRVDLTFGDLSGKILLYNWINGKNDVM